MDVFSHGLWAAVGSKAVNLRKEKKLNSYLAAFWGVFPDVFAFTPFFIWMIWNRLQGRAFTPPRAENMEPLQNNANYFVNLSQNLYNYSHSLVIFSSVVLTVLFVRYLWKKDLKSAVPWEMAGWLLHILIDIPTHTYEFYPTPVFWPIGDWKFDGFSWGQSWFIVLNYSLLLLVFILLRRKSSFKRA